MWCIALLRPVLAPVLQSIAAEAMTNYRHSKGQTIDSWCFSLKTSSMHFWKFWTLKKKILQCLSTTSIYFLSVWGNLAFPLQLSLHDIRICLHKWIFWLRLGSGFRRMVFLLVLVCFDWILWALCEAMQSKIGLGTQPTFQSFPASLSTWSLEGTGTI